MLKLLRETYLGRVKMIYIDPPYNTGNDFVYKDDFRQTTDDYLAASGQFDDQGQRLETNTETNGRYHTDWLNMIYPRLRLARELLTDDGVIFISIDDHEVENLKKVCNEVFGEKNFVNAFITRRYDKNLNRQFMDDGLKSFNVGSEYILCYKRHDFLFAPVFRKASGERATTGYWKGFWNDADRPTMRYELLGYTPNEGQWKWERTKALEAVANYREYEEKFSSTMTLEEYWIKTGKTKKFIRRNQNGKGKNAGVENWIEPTDTILRTTNWLDLLASKDDPSTQGLFDSPKNPEVINQLLLSASDKSSLILDFFSGSATTAHAVMQLNAEDGGNRRFIMVQVPEACAETSEAYKAGYATICEIGKERIRRAGKKIREEMEAKQAAKRAKEGLFAQQDAPALDTGFRVLKLASTNMEDVYYQPRDVLQGDLFKQLMNVKGDRTPFDLLFQVMLELGITLDADIREEEIAGRQVYRVNDTQLVACFEPDCPEAVVEAISRLKPLYAVVREPKDDATMTNFDEFFKTNSPDTHRRTL